jgi:hypothetical protein
MQYLGDFAEDSTVYMPFNTFSSNDPQASVTITNLVDADIKVHKDGGLTQIVTDGATIAIDYDAITGNHLITIDTSASADYAIGSDYIVRIEGTTVDAGTINAFIGSFSIENRFDNNTATAAALATAQTDLDTITGAAGAILDSTATSAQLVDDILDEAISGSVHSTAGSLGNRIYLGQSNSWTSSTVNDASATTTVFITNLSSSVDDFYRDQSCFFVSGVLAGQSRIISAYNGTTKAITVSEATTSAVADGVVIALGASHVHSVSEIQSGLATEAKQDVIDGIIDDILLDTDELQTNQGNWLTATGFATETKQDIIDTNVDAILVDTGTTLPATLAAQDVVLSELNSGIIYSSAATGTLSTTVATTNLTGYADDQLIGRVMIVLSGNAEGEATDITDYANASGTLTFTALTIAMANGDTFKIV